MYVPSISARRTQIARSVVILRVQDRQICTREVRRDSSDVAFADKEIHIADDWRLIGEIAHVRRNVVVLIVVRSAR